MNKIIWIRDYSKQSLSEKKSTNSVIIISNKFISPVVQVYRFWIWICIVLIWRRILCQNLRKELNGNSPQKNNLKKVPKSKGPPPQTTNLKTYPYTKVWKETGIIWHYSLYFGPFAFWELFLLQTVLILFSTTVSE